MLWTIIKKLSIFIFPKIILSSAFALSLIYQKQDTGKLHGTVKDISGYGISSATITIEGNESRSVSCDELGRYKIVLKPGWYKMSVSREGFFDATRARFYVFQKGAINFDFILVAKRITDHEGAVSSNIKVENYKQDFFIKDKDKFKSEILFLYGKKNAKDKIITYEGFESEIKYGSKFTSRNLPVIMTVNRVTVMADRISFNQYFEIEAEGNVHISNGRNIFQTKKVIIWIKNRHIHFRKNK
jgi:hypothetical protein